MGLQLEQSQKQKQVLSQQMIQAVQILQMNMQELTEYMKKEVLDNPVVEIEKAEVPDPREDRIRKLEWLASLDEQNRSFYRYDREAMEENNGLNNLSAASSESLEETLKTQLLGGGYTDLEMEIFNYVAHCLDSRGYFTGTAEEIAGHFQVSEQRAEKYLEIMRDLEPYGVCAADLKGCLLKQIEKREDCGEKEALIVSNYLEMLGKNQLPAIAQKSGMSLEETAEAVERIRSLNPRPAQGFDNGELFRYIVPDVTVVKFQDRFEILLNDYACPVLHINQDYLKMMKSDCGEEVKTYLEDKITRAERIQENVHKRNSTLLALTETILDVQSEFFMTGKNELHPFRIQDAAERMGLHESTISRAVRGKYLQCCWGIYPLYHFFPKGVFCGSGGEGEIATECIKKRIRKLIEKEDPKKPYSDQKISELLKECGMEISRRTVAKYRECMGIKNGRERKQFI
jgi:RNA polymerase sigma-54 factor